jgi:hypothetical protein
MGGKTQPQYQDQSGMFKSPYHEDNTVAVLGISKKSEFENFSIGSRFFLKKNQNQTTDRLQVFQKQQNRRTNSSRYFKTLKQLPVFIEKPLVLLQFFPHFLTLEKNSGWFKGMPLWARPKVDSPS